LNPFLRQQKRSHQRQIPPEWVVLTLEEPNGLDAITWIVFYSNDL